jgi:hypothetical protein
MKILEFKSVSPLFEMLRDGTMPFTTRKVDYHDPRWRALSQWRHGCNWGIRITNSRTGKSFIRKLEVVDFVRWLDFESRSKPKEGLFYRFQALLDWRILVLGEIVEE